MATTKTALPLTIPPVRFAFWAGLGLGSAAALGAQQTVVGTAAGNLEFFENRIRPLLIENCYECHSAGAERVRGGFRLDSAPALRRGGDSGEVVIPFAAEESRLIHMVRHHPDFESMPPKSKLSTAQIDDLMTWIDQGIPDPRTIEPEFKDLEDGFDLEERRNWWSLQPVSHPTVPAVADTAWPSNDYDHFILAALEDRRWRPAAPADRRSLLRRLSFDLTGLAPTPAQLDAFVSDARATAYATQVERLLDSPHFGEQWARHWMDLVRYGETKSFEQDYTMPEVYRYRDYLIRAFNADVPFNQFIVEALAGDLIRQPRLDPASGHNESVLGPGFLFLSDGQHGPPDLHEDEARIFARTIDVTAKSLLGSTIACARCHDHKFDAITTADYYSLYGLLRSSRLSYINTVTVEQQLASLPSTKAAHAKVREPFFHAIKPEIDQAYAYLEMRRELLAEGSMKQAMENLRADYPEEMKPSQQAAYVAAAEGLIQEACEKRTPTGLDPAILKNWMALALMPASRARWPELSALIDPAPATSANQTHPRSAAFASLTESFDGWIFQDTAFSRIPEAAGNLILAGAGESAVQGLTSDAMIAGTWASRISGVVRSPEFVLDGQPLRLQAKGRFATVRLVIRNYELTGRGPTTDKLAYQVDGDHWQDIVIPTYLWQGLSAYLEINHHGQMNHSRRPRDALVEYQENAYIAFRFDAGPDWDAWWEQATGSARPISSRMAADLFQAIWHRGQTGELNAPEADLLSALIGAGLVNTNRGRTPELASSIAAYRAAAHRIPAPRYARSLVDGIPADEPVYIRGSHKNLSKDPNPRHYLDGLGGGDIVTAGSGRMEWARHVADPANPLTARVIVNRLWKHLFGTGIVTTVNDFGRMGSAPSHPALLDHLARDLVNHDWSLKHLIRKMVSTSTYQMSTSPGGASVEQDPANRLLQHMPVKRLTAEEIRDLILTVSGQLDLTMFGPSVAAYVDDLPDSRAKPRSGPIDGDGRRSIYLEMRRSFLPTFLRAFDLPNATAPVGARQVTNVPAQSLALLNDPLVHRQAQAWARRTLDQPAANRIDQLHLMAFGRPATNDETAWAQRLIQTMAARHGTSPEALAPWTDLCHLMINRKEFIYLL